MAPSTEAISTADQFRSLTTAKAENFQKSSDLALPVALQNLRFYLGIATGVAAGIAPIMGYNGFLTAALVVVFLPFWHCKYLLRIPLEGDGEYKSSELLSEGSMLVRATHGITSNCCTSRFQTMRLPWSAGAWAGGWRRHWCSACIYCSVPCPRHSGLTVPCSLCPAATSTGLGQSRPDGWPRAAVCENDTFCALRLIESPLTASFCSYCVAGVSDIPVGMDCGLQHLSGPRLGSNGSGAWTCTEELAR